jgi:hypothetical protein
VRKWAARHLQDNFDRALAARGSADLAAVAFGHGNLDGFRALFQPGQMELFDGAAALDDADGNGVVSELVDLIESGLQAVFVEVGEPRQLVLGHAEMRAKLGDAELFALVVHVDAPLDHLIEPDRIFRAEQINDLGFQARPGLAVLQDGQERGMEAVAEEAVIGLFLGVGPEKIDPESDPLAGLGIPVAHFGEGLHQPVEGFMQPVIAVVAAAEDRFLDAIDFARRDVVPGMGEKLVVKHELGAVERTDLHRIDELGRLYDRADIVRVERIAGHANVEGAQLCRPLRAFGGREKGGGLCCGHCYAKLSVHRSLSRRK